MSGAGRGSSRVSPTGDLGEPIVFSGESVGTVLPYAFSPFAWLLNRASIPLVLTGGSAQIYQWNLSDSAPSSNDLRYPQGTTRLRFNVNYSEGSSSGAVGLIFSFAGQRRLVPVSQSASPDSLITLNEEIFLVPAGVDGFLELNVPPVYDSTNLTLRAYESGDPANPGTLRITAVYGDNLGFTGVQNNISV